MTIIKQSRVLELIVFALLLFCLLSNIYMVSFLPLYPDEVAYRILLERSVINSGYKQSLTPYCSTGFMVQVPLIFKPISLLWSNLTYITSNATYRFAPSTVLLISVIIPCFLKGFRSKLWVYPFLFVFLLGSSIWALDILRPEAFLILMVSILGYVACDYMNMNGMRRVCLVFVVIFVYWILVYTHPKVIYYLLPVVFILAALVFSNDYNLIKALLYFLTCFFVLYLTFAAYEIHTQGFLNCDEFSNVSKIMGQQSVNLISLFENPLQFIEGVLNANRVSVLLYSFNNIVFRSIDPINVLPPIQLSPVYTNSLNGIVFVTLCFVALLALKLLFKYTKFALKSNINQIQIVVFISLYISIFLPFVLNLNKHWYDSALFVSLFGVATYYLIFTSLNNLTEVINPILKMRLLSWLLVFVVLISTIANFFFYYLPIRNGFDGIGIGYKFNYSIMKTELDKELLGIDFDGRIIVDDATYSYFKDVRLVYPVTYLMLHAAQYPDSIAKGLSNYSTFGVTRCTLMQHFGKFVGVEFKKRIAIDSDLNNDLCIWHITLPIPVKFHQ